MLSHRTALKTVLLCALAAGPACRATGPAPGEPIGEPRPYVPLPDEEPPTIGYFLTLFDGWLLRWSDLRLSAASPKDRNELLALEQHMREKSAERRLELVQELESGAPSQRRIAAAALGFTGDPAVLGPLLASLDDRDPELAQRTLLALGVLALPETPLGGIKAHLLGAEDAWTRNNAAFAMLAIARAGNHSPELAEACRLGLADAEAGVRAQCASALGVVADVVAVPALAELLYDRANLVALAASVSLASIGRTLPEQRGATARALSASLDRVPDDRRAPIVGALRWLSGLDLGDDAKAWVEWAHKLP